MSTLLINYVKLIFSLLFLVSTVSVNSQNTLDHYVEQGLKNNIVLKQKNISLDKAMYSLKTAQSLFYPNVGFKADYQYGDGGRNISIPVGDLLNPVYTTLNQLTQTQAFPQVSNSETNFLPKNYYDFKIRTSMPIYNRELVYNKQIANQQLILQQNEIEIYKSELCKNIKLAYFNYLSASKTIAIYESTMLLATEAKRVNESLLKNGKSLKAYVLRSESEIQNLIAKKTQAVEQANNAKLYFNFLLNTSISQNIDTTGNELLNTSLIEQYLISDPEISNRTELKSLEFAEKINATVIKMNKSWRLPSLNAYLDLGSQASDWKFNSKTKYYLFGLQLDMPIYTARKNDYKIRQAELDLDITSLSKDLTTKQIELAANIAKNNLSSVYENYKASLKQLEAAISYNGLIEKGFKEGVNSFLETIDARNQLSSASILVTVNKYQLLGAVANYEREILK